MFRQVLFAVALVLLGISFYYSRNFQLIAAGIAVLLFGMRFMEEGFARVATGTLHKLIKRLNKSLMLSFFLGIVATTALQSSSLISVITISFLSTGLLGLPSGLAIIFGANIGSTTTTWIIALLGIDLNISSLALPLLFFGILLQSRKIRMQKALGQVLLGLGGFFMGIFLMQLGFKDFQSASLLPELSNNAFFNMAYAFCAGLLITAILQSSAASMAIIISALALSQLTYTQSLAMAVGANVGTTVTAIIGAFGARLPGKQLALGHFIFNVVTAIVALSILPYFSFLVDKSAVILDLSPKDLSLKLALFHTLFNVLGVLILFPLIKPLIKLLQLLKFGGTAAESAAKFLSTNSAIMPQTTLIALVQESRFVLNKLIQHMEIIIRSARDREDDSFLKQLVQEEQQPFIEYYYGSLKPVLAQIQQTSASLAPEFHTEQFSIASRLMAEIARDFNHLLKDVENSDLMEEPHFVAVYNELLLEITKTTKSVKESLKNNNVGLLEKQLADFDAYNTALTSRINQYIRAQKLSAMAGTTLIHNADYTKRIIHKLIRTLNLLQQENFLESEAKSAFL